MTAEEITAALTAVGVIASLGAVAFQLYQQNVLTRKRVEEEFLRELLNETQRFSGAVHTHLFFIGLVSRWTDWEDDELPMEARIHRALAVRDLRSDIESYYAVLWRVMALLTALDDRRGIKESKDLCSEVESLADACAVMQKRVAAAFSDAPKINEVIETQEFDAFLTQSKRVGMLIADRLAKMYLRLEMPEA